MLNRSCLLALFTLASCSRKAPLVIEAAPAEKSSAASAKPHTCSADAGSLIDVASEPPFRAHAQYESWTDRDGCLVRIDVLFERPGPAHCNQQDTRVIGMGIP